MDNTQPQTINFLPSNQVQLLTDLISCDAEHDDALSFCLITLDAAAITTILDTHRRMKQFFPDAHEITLKDCESCTQFLTADETDVLETTLRRDKDGEYRLITCESEFIELTEDDNSREAWQIDLRKIIIRETDVRFVGVYEYNPLLRNAFAASPMIPLAVFEKGLGAIRFETRRKLTGGFVSYEELASFFKAEDEKTLLQVPMLADGSPDLREAGELNAAVVKLDALSGENLAEFQAILAELLDYNVIREGENN